VQNCLNFKSFAGSRHFIDEFSLGRVGEDLIGIKSNHASSIRQLTLTHACIDRAQAWLRSC
jgi:hypothetical protein